MAIPKKTITNILLSDFLINNFNRETKREFGIKKIIFGSNRGKVIVHRDAYPLLVSLYFRWLALGAPDGVFQLTK